MVHDYIIIPFTLLLYVGNGVILQKVTGNILFGEAVVVLSGAMVLLTIKTDLVKFPSTTVVVLGLMEIIFTTFSGREDRGTLVVVLILMNVIGLALHGSLSGIYKEGGIKAVGILNFSHWYGAWTIRTKGKDIDIWMLTRDFFLDLNGKLVAPIRKEDSYALVLEPEKLSRVPLEFSYVDGRHPNLGLNGYAPQSILSEIEEVLRNLNGKRVKFAITDERFLITEHGWRKFFKDVRELYRV